MSTRQPFQFIILSIFVIVVTVITTLSTNAFIKNQNFPDTIQVNTQKGVYQFAFGTITSKNFVAIPGIKGILEQTVSKEEPALFKFNLVTGDAWLYVNEFMVIDPNHIRETQGFIFLPKDIPCKLKLGQVKSNL